MHRALQDPTNYLEEFSGWDLETEYTHADVSPISPSGLLSVCCGKQITLTPSPKTATRALPNMAKRSGKEEATRRGGHAWPFEYKLRDGHSATTPVRVPPPLQCDDGTRSHSFLSPTEKDRLRSIAHVLFDPATNMAGLPVRILRSRQPGGDSDASGAVFSHLGARREIGRAEKPSQKILRNATHVEYARDRSRAISERVYATRACETGALDNVSFEDLLRVKTPSIASRPLSSIGRAATPLPDERELSFTFEIELWAERAAEQGSRGEPHEVRSAETPTDALFKVQKAERKTTKISPFAEQHGDAKPVGDPQNKMLARQKQYKNRTQQTLMPLHREGREMRPQTANATMTQCQQLLADMYTRPSSAASLGGHGLWNESGGCYRPASALAVADETYPSQKTRPEREPGTQSASKDQVGLLPGLYVENGISDEVSQSEQIEERSECASYLSLRVSGDEQHRTTMATQVVARPDRKDALEVADQAASPDASTDDALHGASGTGDHLGGLQIPSPKASRQDALSPGAKGFDQSEGCDSGSDVGQEHEGDVHDEVERDRGERSTDSLRESWAGDSALNEAHMSQYSFIPPRVSVSISRSPGHERSTSSKSKRSRVGDSSGGMRSGARKHFTGSSPISLAATPSRIMKPRSIVFEPNELVPKAEHFQVSRPQAAPGTPMTGSRRQIDFQSEKREGERVAATAARSPIPEAAEIRSAIPEAAEEHRMPNTPLDCTQGIATAPRGQAADNGNTIRPRKSAGSAMGLYKDSLFKVNFESVSGQDIGNRTAARGGCGHGTGWHKLGGGRDLSFQKFQNALKKDIQNAQAHKMTRTQKLLQARLSASFDSTMSYHSPFDFESAGDKNGKISEDTQR